MHFPFDDTLVGYQEVVSLKTSDLPIPLFTFPKGSFFVDNTYAKIKGTNKILRPGIDYLVLSCNETIPFSSDLALNLKLKQAYVRNAILLRTNAVIELDWYVAYCGGEETTKAAEYDNYIDQLFNEARLKGTTNLLTYPHQAWGGYLNPDNSQIMSGKHIYSKAFQAAEEIEIGGGLGWGKVELAVQALAESVTNGNDPAVVDAFFNWSKHNEIEYNKMKALVSSSLDSKIKNLNGKRLDIGQFTFKEDNTLPSNMNFIEHKNVILRGIDPNDTYQVDPINTKRANVGFYGLAESGYDVGINAVKLFQRVEQPGNKVPHGVYFAKEIAAESSVAYSFKKEAGVITTGTHTLYVVSKNNGIIHTRDVTALLADPAAKVTNFTFTYVPNQNIKSTDTLFAYVLDNNMQGDFSWVGHCQLIVQQIANLFEVDVLNHGNMIGANPTFDPALSPEFEVIVRRNYNVHAMATTMTVTTETGSVVQINGKSSEALSFKAGEEEKRIQIKLTNTSPLANFKYLVVNVGAVAKPLATAIIGLRPSGRQDYAQISLRDNLGKLVSSIDVNNTYNLHVQFSKDADYYLDELTLELSKLIGTTAVAKMGEKIIVDNTSIIYPIDFTGSLDAVVSLKLKDINNVSFQTNVLNIAYNTSTVNPGSPIFTPIVVGRHVVIKRNTTNFELDFAIGLKDHTQGGFVFDLNSNNPDLSLPTSVISSQGLVRFKGTIPINKLNTGSITLNFIRAGQTFPLSFTVNIDKLIPVEIEYRDGAHSSKALETRRFFRIMVANPFVDRRITFSRENFPAGLGITNISYGNALTEIIEATVTLEPGERKQLTVGDWVSIEHIETNAAQIIRYAPNCNVSQVLMSNGSVVKTGPYLTEVGEILINKEEYEVQAINLSTGNALFDHGMVDNFIDIIAQFPMDTTNIKSVVVTTNTGYQASVRGITTSVDGTLIVSLTVKRNESNPQFADGINFTIDCRDGNLQALYKVSASVTGS